MNLSDHYALTEIARLEREHRERAHELQAEIGFVAPGPGPLRRASARALRRVAERLEPTPMPKPHPMPAARAQYRRVRG